MQKEQAKLEINFCYLKGKVPRPNWFIALTKPKGAKFKETPRHVSFQFGQVIFQASPSLGHHIIGEHDLVERYIVLAKAKYVGVAPTKDMIDNLLLMYPLGTAYDQDNILYFTWRVTMKLFRVFKNVIPKHGKNKKDKLDKAMCVELFDAFGEFCNAYKARYPISKGSHAMVAPPEFFERIKNCPDFQVQYFKQ